MWMLVGATHYTADEHVPLIGSSGPHANLTAVKSPKDENRFQLLEESTM